MWAGFSAEPYASGCFQVLLLQIPPAPPRPDFDASREKLQKLGEGEGSMTKEEFTKMKQELEAWVSTDSSCCRRSCLTCWISHHIARFVLLHREYLAIFKKTVAMHEVFLCRVAAHPVLRKDLNFHVFLEYNQDVSISFLGFMSSSRASRQSAQDLVVLRGITNRSTGRFYTC